MNVSFLDPNTPLGSIAGNTIATLAAAAFLAALAFVMGLLRWFIQNRRLKELISGERPFTFVFNPLQGMRRR